LIDALRATAERLRGETTYRWTHMGACNCGHLAQTVTELSREELHAMATARAGDWSEQAREYCGASGYPIDHVIGTMLGMGLTREDIADLERLSGRAVLRSLPPEARGLDHRRKADVVRYLDAWAALLEAQHPGSEASRRELAEVADLAAEGRPRGAAVEAG
jgi:hypothetical protein